MIWRHIHCPSHNDWVLLGVLVLLDIRVLDWCVKSRGTGGRFFVWRLVNSRIKSTVSPAIHVLALVFFDRGKQDILVVSINFLKDLSLIVLLLDLGSIILGHQHVVGANWESQLAGVNVHVSLHLTLAQLAHHWAHGLSLWVAWWSLSSAVLCASLELGYWETAVQILDVVVYLREVTIAWIIFQKSSLGNLWGHLLAVVPGVTEFLTSAEISLSLVHIVFCIFWTDHALLFDHGFYRVVNWSLPSFLKLVLSSIFLYGISSLS